MTETDFSVEVPGGMLRGVRSGQGEALLVLHGGPGMNDYSSWFVAELDGWAALRYTQRGVGPSVATGPFTADRHVADALAVLDQHQIGAAVVLGHSWGGYLAIRLAAAAPQRVRALILVDSLGGAGDGGLSEFGQRMVDRASSEALARIAELDERASAAPGSVQADADAVESLRLIWPSYFPVGSAVAPWPEGLRLGQQCNEQTMESVAADRASGQLASELTAFSGPVEIIAGTAGPMPVEVSLATAAMFGDAEVTELPAAGHFPWVESPGCLAAALGRVAARLGQAR